MTQASTISEREHCGKENPTEMLTNSTPLWLIEPKRADAFDARMPLNGEQASKFGCGLLDIAGSPDMAARYARHPNLAFFGKAKRWISFGCRGRFFSEGQQGQSWS